MRGKRVLSVYAVFGLISMSAWSAELDLQVSADELISLRAVDTPVEEVIMAVGDELGITVSFPSPVTHSISVDFQELKLEQALKQITSSYILVTGKGADPQRVHEIIVMPEGESSGYLPTGGNIAEQNKAADQAAGIGEEPEEDEQVRTGLEQVQERLRPVSPQGAGQEDTMTRLKRRFSNTILPELPVDE